MKLLDWRRKKRQELDEELASHLEIATRERIERGEPPEQAARAARREFGNVDLIRDVTRDAWGWTWADEIGQDVACGWRRLRSTPLFTTFAVLTLAVGLGVTTAVYSIVRAALAPPSGVRDARTLVYLFHTPCCSVPIHALSWLDFEDLRDRQTVYRRVAAFGRIPQTIVAHGGSEAGVGEIVSGEYFDVLDVRAALGRTLQPQDDRPGAPLVVVLNHGIWQRLFAGSPDAIGQTVKIGGHDFEVVGVAPRQFRGLSNSGLIPTPVWVPLQAAPLFPSLGVAERRDDRSRRWLQVVGRLAAGRTIEEAAAEATLIGGQLDVEFPIGQDLDRRRRAPFNISRPWAVRSAADLRINIAADRVVGWLAAVLLTVVGVVLMVACTNLANLMLARGSFRRPELAVRLALGASPWRLAREALTESLLLAAAGGLAGLGLAHVITISLGTELTVGQGATLFVEPRLDGMVLLASFGATVLALLVAGIGPALQSATADVRSALATEVGEAVLPRWRGRRLLISGQVAVSVVLLAVASLFLRQLVEESRLDSGLAVDRLVVAEVDFSGQGIEEVRTRQIAAGVVGQLSGRSDVEAAAVSSGLPIGMTTPGAVLRGPDGGTTLAEFVSASPGIFDTLGVSIVRGRAFDERDVWGSQAIMVVNETAARKLFGTIEVVGHAVEVERRRWVGQAPQPAHTRTIVGVASDSDAGSIGRRESGVIYLPFEQQFEGRLVFSARSAGGEPGALVAALREAVRAAAPEIGLLQIGTGNELVAPPNLFARISAAMSALLGTFALLLALSGLYGLLSHLVARRTREIGVRLALGASQAEILRLIIREGLGPVAVGLLAGGLLGWLARQGLQPRLAGLVPGVDPLALGGVLLSLVAVGVLACYLPARRAARVDPNVALRAL